MPLSRWNRRTFVRALASMVPVCAIAPRMVLPRGSVPKPFSSFPEIRIVGVGYAGGRILDFLVASGVAPTELVAVNGDASALENCRASGKIQIGRRLCRGLGAGARPEIGRRAVTENLADVVQAMNGAGLIILTGGLGGGTASGAMPVLARAALSSGAEVLAVVTFPAIQEGRKRERVATAALAELHQIVKRVETVPLLVGSTWSVETFKSTSKVANHILDVRHTWFVGESWT